MSRATDIADTLRYIADCLSELDRIVNLPNCNDCAMQGSCDKRPEWGTTVRFNCPLWVKNETKKED